MCDTHFLGNILLLQALIFPDILKKFPKMHSPMLMKNVTKVKKKVLDFEKAVL